MDTIISWLTNALGWVFGLLPDSPFQNLLNAQPVAQYLGYVAYFVDVGFMVNAFDVWLGVIAVYYIYMAVLRWIHAIGNS